MVDRMDEDFFDPPVRNTPNIDEYKKSIKSERELNRAEFCDAIFHDITAGEDSFLDSLEMQYQSAMNEIDPIKRNSLELRGINIRGANRKNLLDALDKTISYGLYPPPELLLALCECYEEYIAGNGEIHLEELLCGRSLRGKGNFAQQETTKLKYEYFENVFLPFVGERFPDGEMIYKNQVDAVVAMLNEQGDFDTDPETYLRSWRLWRKVQGRK